VTAHQEWSRIYGEADFPAPGPIIYLSGSQSGLPNSDRVGVMVTPRNALRPAGSGWWAADNGCFTAGESFDPAAWLQWLDSLPRNAIFAVAPDVPFDAEATWRRSEPYLEKIMAMGFTAALAAQDGLTSPEWDAFDCLFIAGSTDWKLGPVAERLAREALDRGKWVHMGRVNSRKRLEYAQRIGCDSADGTYLRFGPDKNGPKLAQWIESVGSTPTLWNEWSAA
jgi:hypothetical protein